MSKLKTVSALLLVLLVCLTTAVGCNRTGDGEVTLSPYFTESETSAPPPAPTLGDYIDALIPSSEGKKYELADVRRLNKSEGRTMRVLCWDSPVMEFENTSTDDEYTSADRRLDLLAADLGVTLVLDHRAGGKLDVKSFVDYAATVDGAGKSTYDVIAAYSKAAALLAQKGLLSSLSTGRVKVDTNREWYPDGIGESLSFGNDLYFVTGDISPTALYSAELFFFDVREMSARGIDPSDLYESAFSGKWTLDAMFELLAQADLPVREETGETGTYPVEDPVTYRLTVSRTGLASLYFSAGLSIVDNIHDYEQGRNKLVLSPEYTGGVSSTLHARLISAINNGEMRVPSVTGQNFFGDNADSVAWIGALSAAASFDRELGILPLPKLNDRADYVGVTSDAVTFWGVPASLDEDSRDLAVIFIEQAGYFSGQAMVDDTCFSLLRSFSRTYTVENSQIFDIHRRNLSFDIGVVAAGTEKLTLSAVDGWASLIIGKNSWETYSGTIAVSLAEQIESLNNRNQ